MWFNESIKLLAQSSYFLLCCKIWSINHFIELICKCIIWLIAFRKILFKKFSININLLLNRSIINLRSFIFNIIDCINFINRWINIFCFRSLRIIIFIFNILIISLGLIIMITRGLIFVIIKHNYFLYDFHCLTLIVVLIF